LSPDGGWVAIVNPRAGGGLSSAALERLTTALGSAVGRVLVSERPGHVEALVRQSHAAVGILVVGGDGTVFEVLQAIDRARQRLGILPNGRGNSLARDLGLHSARDAVASIRSGRDRTIDLVAVTVRQDDGRQWRAVSASNLAVGYPAAVVRDAARWRRLGACSYAIASTLSRPDRLLLRLTLDGGLPAVSSATGVIVSNSKHVGPFLGFPSASLSDGIVHLMELRAGRLRQVTHNLSALTRLRFYEPAVIREVHELLVELDPPALLQVDGELREGVREIAVQVLPRAGTFRVQAEHHD
jgi:diacylglycerol kinase family enzyme